jgi:hypothetical protein
MQRRHLLFCGLAGFAQAGAPAWAAAANASQCGSTLRYPTASLQADLRNEFATQLLKLALSAAACPVEVTLVGEFTQPTGLQAVREGRLDVALASAALGDAPGVLTVREPIRRGLLGVRLLVCKVSRAAEIGAVGSLDALRKRYVLGHGADWADLPLYKSQGFRVVTAQSYAELFDLVHQGRCDILSRGVTEVWDEVDSGEHGRGQLMTVPHIGLTSVVDDYFVLRPDATELQALLSNGLATIQRDGRYQRLFEQHYKLAMRRSALQHRQLFALSEAKPDARVVQAQQALLRSVASY